MHRTTTSLDSISLASLRKCSPGKGHPKPVIYEVKLEFGPLTEDDMLPMSHCQVLPPLCPLQVETVVIGSQQGLLCGSMGTATIGQEPVVVGLLASPHSIQIPHLHRQGPSTWQGVVFWGAPVDLLGTKVPVAACLWRMWLTLARVRPMQPAIALCHTSPHGQVQALHA